MKKKKKKREMIRQLQEKDHKIAYQMEEFFVILLGEIS